jgi:hypothetical protein
MVLVQGELTMEINLDTFLTTVYCIVDDHYQAEFAQRKPVRRGRRPELSDSEVVTLMLLAQWQGRRSEAAFVAYAAHHWRAFFPRQLSQSAFNRRGRDVAMLLCALGPSVVERTMETFGLPARYEVVDGVPVPLMRRTRGGRHRCFADEAGFGRGGADKEWYYGMKLLAVVNEAGLITGFVVGPAGTEERWLAEAFFAWRQDLNAPEPTAERLAERLGPTHRAGGERKGPTGPIRPRQGVGKARDVPTLGDLGFAGAQWGQHWRAAYSAVMLTKAALRDPNSRHWFNSRRQKVETAFALLVDRLGLKFPRARAHLGVLARLGAKVAAYNLAIHFNLLNGRPTHALFNPLEA